MPTLLQMDVQQDCHRPSHPHFRRIRVVSNPKRWSQLISVPANVPASFGSGKRGQSRCATWMAAARSPAVFLFPPLRWSEASKSGLPGLRRPLLRPSGALTGRELAQHALAPYQALHGAPGWQEDTTTALIMTCNLPAMWSALCVAARSQRRSLMPTWTSELGYHPVPLHLHRWPCPVSAPQPSTPVVALLLQYNLLVVRISFMGYLIRVQH